jgi:hypothetical protein
MLTRDRGGVKPLSQTTPEIPACLHLSAASLSLGALLRDFRDWQLESDETSRLRSRF